MLTMCECWEGEWCACVFVWECTLRHTYATRCGCIQQTTHSETIFNKAARPPQSVKTDRAVGSNWRVVKPAESRRGGGGGGGGFQPVPCPPPEANLHISCILIGIIWVRMIGKTQMQELSMSIFILCH